jgi:hypothetical protein
MLPNLKKDATAEAKKEESKLDRIFRLFRSVLDAHIGTKGVDSLFHEKSAAFYEAIFSAYHLISEKEQDIEQSKPIDCQKAAETAYGALEEAKGIVEDMVKDNDGIGMDNLLRGIVDKLESSCGDARAFTDK